MLYANPAAEQLYGHRRAVLVGANVLDLLVGPVDRQWAEQIMAQVAAGQPWTGEFGVPHADGSTRTVRIIDSPVWRDGAVVAVVGVAEDITQSQAVQADADRLGARLAQLARVTAVLAAARDVQTVTDAVVTHAAAALGASVASLSLLTGSDTLTLVGIRGTPPAV